MESLSNFDVIIIGAGAAGIACGRYFEESALSYQILEASSEIGGRCVTINGTSFKPII